MLVWSGIEINPGPSKILLENFRIAHNNVCRLLSKLDIVSYALSDFDIIAISETHLDNSTSTCNNDLALPGYHIPLQKDINRFGGGGALYIYI